jgi:hypothetical protein
MPTFDSELLNSKATVTFGALTKIINGALFPIFKALQQRIEKLEGGTGSQTRHVDIERRLRALEDRPTMEYKGVWLENTPYAPGNVVTSGGSMWYCNIATRSEPGVGHSRDWTLCVKRGREGRGRRE